jgi:hypothetical protein
LGQGADFRGHDGETPARLTRPRRFDPSVSSNLSSAVLNLRPRSSSLSDPNFKTQTEP